MSERIKTKVRNLRDAIDHIKYAQRLLEQEENTVDADHLKQVAALVQNDVTSLIVTHFPVVLPKNPLIGIFKGDDHA